MSGKKSDHYGNDDPRGRFVAKRVIWAKPACITCARLSRTDSSTCEAFPGGIPYEIDVGEDDHRSPYPGDHGLQYAAR